MAEYVLLVSCILGVGFLATTLSARLKIPHSVLLVLLGMVGGALSRSQGLATSADIFQHFPDVVLYLLLPPLVFESAYHLDVHALRRDVWPLSFLSVGALMVSCLFIGGCLHGFLDLPWRAALLFGALISATDPVAVVALFRELGARERLTVLVEGESLFNDGTAIVLFRVLLGGGASLWTAGGQFLLVSLGGIGVGLVFIYVFRSLLRLTAASAGPTQVGLTVTAAYLSYVVADHVLGVSGVLSTLTLGLYLGTRARLTLNREALHSMHGVWGFFALSANSIVFLAVGMSFDLTALRAVAPLLPVTLLGVYAARFLSVVGSLTLVNRLGLSERIRLREQLVIMWGGLRGGLALALVLILPADFAYKSQFLALSTAVVLATLLFNALTIRWLQDSLHINRLTPQEEFFASRSLAHAMDDVFEVLDKASHQGVLSEQLLEDMRGRTRQRLVCDETTDPRPFALRQLLAHEQNYYDEQLELGILSTEAFLHLSRCVHHRLDELDRDGADKLCDFDFTFEDARRATEMLSLELQLEILLHLGLGLEYPATGPTDVREAWRASAREQMDRFQRLHPRLGTAVQSSFVAHTLAATAGHALAHLRDSGVINPTVFVRASEDLGRLEGELLAEAESLRNPSFRQLLERVRLFAQLPEFALAQVEAWAKRQALAAGTALFQKGDEGNSFYVILHGVLEVRGEEEAPRLFAGSFFGEISLLFDVPRTATVTALVDSEVVEIEKLLFHQILALCPEFRVNVSKVAAQRAQQLGLALPPSFI